MVQLWQSKTWFTFHYVSILINLAFKLSLLWVPFTFHYVSILIFCPDSSGLQKRKIYIPLCLYFNHSGTTDDVLGNEFTFHYVSILILPFCSELPLILWFTFHYVSILIRCFPVLHVISSIYIPLCLYFNLLWLLLLLQGFYLHSIMSLF